MSRTEERIREDLHTLGRPVGIDGVLEGVRRRRSRRRWRRRVGHALLAVAVVGGSVTATVELTRAFGNRGVAIPGGGPQGSGEARELVCDDSQMWIDVDGDGQPDQVDVFSPSSGTSCVASSDVGVQYVLQVSGGKYTTESPHPQPTPYPNTRFYGVNQPLPECEQPRSCRLFAVADLNRDGAREIVVQDANIGRMRSLVVYRLDVSPVTPPVQDVSLTRLTIAAPGDHWSDRYGMEPGPATLSWGASPNAVRSVSCADWAGAPVVVVTTAVPAIGGGWDVHRTDLRVDGDRLTVIHTSDQTVSDAPAMPPEVCGSPIWQPGDSP